MKGFTETLSFGKQGKPVIENEFFCKKGTINISVSKNHKEQQLGLTQDALK